jgi:coenzyme F420-reducing hydrogenase beta subunit
MNESRVKSSQKFPTLFNNECDCCGCSACLEICPKHAISMHVDENWFSYPQIDENKCINCLLCEQVCPLKNDSNNNDGGCATRAFAVRHNSLDVVIKSSSGGAFTLLSDYAFENGWGICCCLYDFDLNCTRFSIITTKEERNIVRGSKYINSHMNDIFRECYSFLNDYKDKNLIFFGLGCQVEGFRKYAQIKNIRDRVILCDLICHGQASEIFWNTQLKKLGLNNVKLEKVTFKDKQKGWKHPRAYIEFNKKVYDIKEYTKLFYSGYIMRPSCYECHFTKPERNSDLTIGDFWGVQSNYPKLYNEMGVSLVLTHSPSGEKILNKIRNNALIEEVNLQKCLQPRLQTPVEKPWDYNEFWNYVKNNGVEEGMNKYGKDSLQEIYRGGYKKSNVSQNGFCGDRIWSFSMLPSTPCA